jgi:hypothetical protein
MPDLNDLAPTIASAQLDPDSVQRRLAPKPAPVEPVIPPLTSTQIDNIVTWYGAGEHNPADLARMANVNVGLVTDLVAEFDSVSAAVAADPAAPMVNTYVPPEPTPIDPGGGKVGPVGGDVVKIP